MYAALIRWFVTVVPMCPLATPMYSILRLMGTDPSSKILVVDDTQKPLGVVSCHELLLGLVYSQPSIYDQSIYAQMVMNPGKLTAVCSVLTGTSQSGSGAEDLPTAIAHQSLQSCLDAVASSIPLGSTPEANRAKSQMLLRPMACISTNSSVHDFQAEYLARITDLSKEQDPTQTLEEPPLDWVVVNPQGDAVGLLDQQRVWRSLALDPQLGQSSAYPVMPDAEFSSDPPDIASDTLSSDEQAQERRSPAARHNPTDGEVFQTVFRQRLEEAQAHIQSLIAKQWDDKSQLRLKNDLMAYISHELKTPLTALVGLSELLLEKMKTVDGSASPSASYDDSQSSADSNHGVHPQDNGARHETEASHGRIEGNPLNTRKQYEDQYHSNQQRSERQHLYAQLIHQSSHQLMALMNSVSDLIYLETGQLTLSPQAIPVEPLCQDAFHQAWQDYHLNLNPIGTDSMHKGSSAQRHWQSVSPECMHSQFSLAIASDLEDVIVDEHRFKHLLSCLCVNGLQLKDSHAPIQITVDYWGEWIGFKVSYEGEGIPLEQQATIFQTIDITHDGVSERFKGIGLRLLLALRLAEKHGGTLTWLSEPDQGMEVTVLLPGSSVTESSVPEPGMPEPGMSESRAIQSSSASPPPLDSVADIAVSDQIRSDKQSALQSQVVVIADDDFLRITQIHQALSSLGYRVAIARSGLEAFKKICDMDASVILLNPSLSYYPGTPLLSILQQREETHSTPIIATVPMASDKRQRNNTLDLCLEFPLNLTVLKTHLEQLTPIPNQSQHRTLSHPITLLYIKPNLDPLVSVPFASSEDLDLNAILYPHHCRVIEVDSIEQAELLARVWSPEVIIMGIQPSHAEHQFSFVHQVLTALKDCDELSGLPIVTLTTDVTECAYSLDLRVFPCLDPLAPVPSNDNQQVTSFALLQVIQLAAEAPAHR